MSSSQGVSKYEGNLKDGKRHGEGIETFPSGKKYEGQWRDGKRHGKGTLTYSDGQKYEGQWKNGLKHGKGTETSPDGSKYVGEFKDGQIYIHDEELDEGETDTISSSSKNEDENGNKDEKKNDQETSISTNEKIPPLKPTKKDKDRIFRIGCISVILIFFGYFLFDKILITTSTQEITELISKKKETWISSSLYSIFNDKDLDYLIKYQEKYGYVDSTFVRSNIALLSNFGRYAKNLCNNNITISVKIKEWGKEIKKDVYPSYYDQVRDCKRRLRNEINKFILNGLIEEQRGMIEIFQETNDLAMEIYIEEYKNAKDLTTKRIFEKEYKKLKREQQIFNRLSIAVQLLITQYRNMVN